MPISEGAAVPTVDIQARVRNDALGGENPFEWRTVSTDQLFKGEKDLNTYLTSI
jgi:peroxiredoxin